MRLYGYPWLLSSLPTNSQYIYIYGWWSSIVGNPFVGHCVHSRFKGHMAILQRMTMAHIWVCRKIRYPEIRWYIFFKGRVPYFQTNLWGKNRVPNFRSSISLRKGPQKVDNLLGGLTHVWISQCTKPNWIKLQRIPGFHLHTDRPGIAPTGWHFCAVLARLVGGIPTPLKNMKVSWDSEIPNWMEKTYSCSKPPTSCCFHGSITVNDGFRVPRDITSISSITITRFFSTILFLPSISRCNELATRAQKKKLAPRISSAAFQKFRRLFFYG